MATPIETNTQELREVLEQVYNLPDRAGGGSSEPDLVIGLNVTNTKIWSDGANGTQPRQLWAMNTDDVIVMSGSASATAEKLKQGLPVRVLLNEIHFYWDNIWYKSVVEAAHIQIGHSSNLNSTYPDDRYDYLAVTFFLANMGVSVIAPAFIQINFNLSTGLPHFYRGTALLWE